MKSRGAQRPHPSRSLETALGLGLERLPVIAIVGRPNVGKSTLFNALTRSRAALVADEPGVTRDRQHGIARIGADRVVLVDTAGMTDQSDALSNAIVRQALQAVEEADVIIMMVDFREGPNAEDDRIAEVLRRSGRPTVLAVNKCEGRVGDMATVDFHHLGLAPVMAISAAHRGNLRPLADAAVEALPEPLRASLAEASARREAEAKRLEENKRLEETNRADQAQPQAVEAEQPRAEGCGTGSAGARTPPPQTPHDDADRPMAVAMLGRPNVGKSTLVNRLTGAQHVVAHDMPGTTRDSVYVPFQRGERRYILIDTAGVRRRARVDAGVEKLSVIKSLQAIEAADVVVLVLDASEGVTEQDAVLLGHILNAGRALVVAANKWDTLRPPERRQLREQVDRKLGFAGFAQIHAISALQGFGLGKLFESVDSAWRAARIDIPTSELTRILEAAVTANPPPLVRGRRIKLRYAHQGGRAPPLVVIHGNQTHDTPAHYQRFLSNFFRERLGLKGTPLRVEFRASENPFKGRKNKLTPRQDKKRQRQRRFFSKK